MRTLCWLKTRSTATASGLVAVEHRLDGSFDHQEALVERVVGRRCRHRDLHQSHAASRSTVDDAQAAAGEARVNAEHAHTTSRAFGTATVAGTEQVFDRTLPGQSPSLSDDTRAD